MKKHSEEFKKRMAGIVAAAMFFGIPGVAAIGCKLTAYAISYNNQDIVQTKDFKVGDIILPGAGTKMSADTDYYVDYYFVGGRYGDYDNATPENGALISHGGKVKATSETSGLIFQNVPKFANSSGIPVNPVAVNTDSAKTAFEIRDDGQLCIYETVGHTIESICGKQTSFNKETLINSYYPYDEDGKKANAWEVVGVETQKYEIENSSGEKEEVEYTLLTLRGVHESEHRFNISTEGDTLTATCTAENCNLPEKEAIVSIDLKDISFNGKGFDVVPKIDGDTDIVNQLRYRNSGEFTWEITDKNGNKCESINSAGSYNLNWICSPVRNTEAIPDKTSVFTLTEEFEIPAIDISDCTLSEITKDGDDFTFSLMYNDTKADSSNYDSEIKTSLNNDGNTEVIVELTGKNCLKGTKTSDTFTFSNYSVTVDNDDNCGTVDINKTSAMKGEKISLTVSPKDGYSINSVTADGNEIYADKNNVYSFNMPEKDITVKTEYNTDSYNIYYELNGGDSNGGNPDSYTVEDNIVFGDPVKTGSSFIGWTDTDNNPITEIPAGSTGDKTIFANWENLEYTLTYEIDGEFYGEETHNYGDYITPIDDPEIYGYTFNGWDSVPETMPDEDVTVNGTLSPNIYEVTFMDGEEVLGEVYPKHNELICEPETPSKDGYVFLFWSEDGTNPYDFSEPVTNNLTLQAVRIDLGELINCKEIFTVTDKLYDHVNLRNYIHYGFDFNVDDNYLNVIKHGILYGMNTENFGDGKADENLRFENYKELSVKDKVRIFASKNTDSVTSSWIEIYIGDNPEGLTYARGFLIVSDKDGNEYLVYSDVKSESFTSLTDK